MGPGLDGIIVQGFLPRYDSDAYLFYSDKTAQRHTNSHAIVNAAFLVGVVGWWGSVVVLCGVVLCGVVWCGVV